jgi:hypothetical protein
MKSAKINIQKALTKEYEDKGKFFYDFRLDLEEETADERAVASLIFAFNAWSNTHWRMNDNLRESISAATKLQKNVRECKEVNSIYLVNSYSSVVEQVGKLKEVENQGAVVTLEAKIELVQNEIDSANERLNQIDENSDLAELMDKMKLKEMRRSVSLMEKEKATLEKIYEKMCGKAYQRSEMVDEISLDEE